MPDSASPNRIRSMYWSQNRSRSSHAIMTLFWRSASPSAWVRPLASKPWSVACWRCHKFKWRVWTLNKLEPDMMPWPKPLPLLPDTPCGPCVWDPAMWLSKVHSTGDPWYLRHAVQAASLGLHRWLHILQPASADPRRPWRIQAPLTKDGVHVPCLMACLLVIRFVIAMRKQTQQNTQQRS